MYIYKRIIYDFITKLHYLQLHHSVFNRENLILTFLLKLGLKKKSQVLEVAENVKIILVKKNILIKKNTPKTFIKRLLSNFRRFSSALSFFLINLNFNKL